ncbi:hypothetical protein Phou_062540 [Phytohabitans houttuyneae]|uniref:Uncharacterized protein n=2 Tax=Phytohabitans houttuyneae TaxID=1076126 RepID=A0A6V8KE49_9ACTN|nr:hypothetical protein Phou_062540 [Phytohabitans houttuyneae]
MVRLVPAPVAVANLVHALSPVPVGANIAVCDLGGGVAATVLHHGVDGFEVVSSLEDPTAGGLQLDEQVAASLDGLSPPGRGTPADPRWWTLMAAARTAKEQLSAQSAVTVSMPPPQPPTVLMAATVQAQARPLWDRAAVLTADAVEAANLQPAQLAGPTWPAAARRCRRRHRPWGPGWAAQYTRSPIRVSRRHAALPAQPGHRPARAPCGR